MDDVTRGSVWPRPLAYRTPGACQRPAPSCQTPRWPFSSRSCGSAPRSRRESAAVLGRLVSSDSVGKTPPDLELPEKKERVETGRRCS